MDSKILRDLLIAVGSSLVRCPNRVVSIFVLATYRAELYLVGVGTVGVGTARRRGARQEPHRQLGHKQTKRVS
jgi:hypothetical protein